MVWYVFFCGTGARESATPYPPAALSRGGAGGGGRGRDAPQKGGKTLFSPFQRVQFFFLSLSLSPPPPPPPLEERLTQRNLTWSAKCTVKLCCRARSTKEQQQSCWLFMCNKNAFAVRCCFRVYILDECKIWGKHIGAFTHLCFAMCVYLWQCIVLCLIKYKNRVWCSLCKALRFKSPV